MKKNPKKNNEEMWMWMQTKTFSQMHKIVLVLSVEYTFRQYYYNVLHIIHRAIYHSLCAAGAAVGNRQAK